MTSLLTADWYPYGKNDFFRKIEVAEMGWFCDVCPSNAIIIPARHGGPIAVIRDRTKPGLVPIKSIGKPVIGIYSSTGYLISSFVWNSGQLVCLEWSSTEDLLCIQENGEVVIYSIFGKYVHAFRMGQEVEDTKVIDAHVFHTPSGTGICVLTGAFRLFLTNTVQEPKVRKLAEIPGATCLPNAWSVVCEERQSYVLMSKGTEIFFISESHVIHKNIMKGDGSSDAVITNMAVSPCHERVAMYSSQQHLWIGSSNLREERRFHDMTGYGRLTELSWCGSDSVVGCWDESLVVVGCSDDIIDYGYDMPFKLVAEMDCVRVITTCRTDIIQPVPKALAETYRLNSTSPGSYLLEAAKQFQKKNHRAHEYIHLVKTQLETAIKQCVEAASHEFTTEHQKMLMKAARFGKTFVHGYDPTEYVRMTRVLRVLNTARSLKIGILLTYPQFNKLTLRHFLDRLILRRHYYLAIEIAKYMRVRNEDGASRILEHWAFYKVAQLNNDREQVAHDIAMKLGSTKDISFINIAKKAKARGRIKLAVKLIDYEPDPALQVTMLLELEKYTEALEKAVDSGNTDLMSLVLLKMQRQMSVKEFPMEVRKDPTVYALYRKQCKEQNKEALINIYKQEGDDNEIAACHVKNAYNPENFSMRSAILENAREHYRKARNEANMILCEEQKRLILKQKELEEKFKREFLDLSLQDTVYRLLTMREVKIADELRTAFRLPERKYWWLRVLSLGELEDWTELDQLSRSKKSPIGFEPFLDVCLQHQNRAEANKYINRVRDENKIRYLVKLKLYLEAIRLAETQRDTQALEYIRANCDTASLMEVNSALVRLNATASPHS